MTPNPDITLRAVADGYVSENTVTSKRIQISNQAADQRRMYVQFDLTLVSRIGHAIVRLRTAKTTGGPVTAYTCKPSPISPALGDAITTVHLTEGGDQYYEWNISEYASQNTGGKLTVVFGIAPSNVAIHSFTSLQSGSPGELLIHTGPID